MAADIKPGHISQTVRQQQCVRPCVVTKVLHNEKLLASHHDCITLTFLMVSLVVKAFVLVQGVN